jgi:hypothetical protein
MSAQFKRGYKLSVVTPEGKALIITDLRVRFEITKDLFGYPNLGDIQIFNLSRDRVTAISQEFTLIELQVGYGGGLDTVFRGDVRNIVSRREGVDTITQFYAGDGERATRDARISKTYVAGTSIKQIIKEMAATFNIPTAKLDGLSTTRANQRGQTFSSATKDAMDKLADDYGFHWSIQDGELVTQGRESYDKDNTFFNINRSTGMIGSPTVTELGADVRTLLNPRLNPYRAIQITTPDVELNVGNLFFRKKVPTLGTGLFRINKVIHTGDTRGNDWTSAITGRRF